MKKILFIILATLLAAWMGASVYYLTYRKPSVPVCEKVEVTIKGSVENHLLTEKEIIDYLTKAKLNPLHKNSDEINTYEIQRALLNNEIIESAEIVQSVSGKITMIVSQKIPVLRVFGVGGSYFVDTKGRTMPTLSGHAIYVPLASGNIEKSFAVSDLYKFALFLQSDEFWNDQITQIYVRTKNDIEIVPRAGSHRILIGNLDDFENKMKRLRLFYEQVIPKMGWEKYSVINLKYRNQIVCTKK